MSIGIYKYQNKINGKVYIGQSQNIEVRKQQHIYDSSHLEQRNNYATGVDYAINKYGIDNFDFEIIEECSIEELDNREIFWIDYYDSYCSGYNRTIGGKSLRGENHPRAILTEDQVWELREMYGQRIKRKDAFQPFLNEGISERSLIKVWKQETWINVHSDVYTEENKEWHRTHKGNSEEQDGLSSLDRAISQDDINIWLKEYESGLSINAIAKKYHKDHGTVQKYIANPIALQKIKYNGRQLKNLNTGKIFESISKAAKWAGCGATTLTRHLETDKTAGKVPTTGEPAIWIELT